jgi:hypothetical protein
MNNSLNSNSQQHGLSNFFRKTEPVVEAPTRAPRTTRPGSRPNYYIYNKHTQEILELQRQCSYEEARQAFSYIARFADPKLLTMWSISGQLQPVQKMRYIKTHEGGDQFEITSEHPLRKALEKTGYNFVKRKPDTSTWTKRMPAIPKITITPLGE